MEFIKKLTQEQINSICDDIELEENDINYEIIKKEIIYIGGSINNLVDDDLYLTLHQ